MPNPKLLILSAIVFAVSTFYGQESLGDAARRMRAEKDRGTAAAAPPTGTASTPAVNTNPPAASAPVAAPPAANAPASAAAPNPYAPYASREEWNLHIFDRFEETVRVMIEKDQFEMLDQMADKARAEKSRMPGGAWTLRAIYEALETPRKGIYNSPESAWVDLLDRLKRWTSLRPGSITARVALADAQMQYAWKARGGGYADSVSDDGWKVFGERLQLAAKTLKEASTLPAKCPDWYLAMQLLAQDMGASREEQTAFFEKAIAFEPDYYYYYRTQAKTLLPKWGGKEGEMTAFAARIADRVGGKKGDMIYFRIASAVNCHCDSDRDLYGMQWSRIKSGYIAVEEQYGEFVGYMNQMASMAGNAGDPVYAEEMFKRIGQAWDPQVWNNRKYFDEVRDWSNGAASAQATIEALKAAQQNLQTPIGQQFDEQIAKSFAANYNATVTDCLKKSGDSFLIPFDMAVQLSKNGAVKKVYVSLHSGTSACLSGKMDQGVFPAPPWPDYWVKISLEARR
jgi:hypothetical protein